MITSTRNEKIAAAARLKRRPARDGARRFLVEGALGVGEALSSDARLDCLFIGSGGDSLADRAAEAGVPVERVSEEVMAKLTSTVTPQGVVAVAEFVDVSLGEIPEDPGCVAVLCAGRDPGNAGTILRSADAAGAGAVVFGSTSVDPYNPKTVRASAGSIFHLPVVRNAEIDVTVEALRERGTRIYAASSEGRESLWRADLSGPVAFLFGNEAWGLPGEIADLADESIRIPLAGRAESLNLAAASTLCMFEYSRRSGRGSGESTASIQEIIAGAAHDIRSPVAATKNFAFALLAGGGDAEEREEMLRGIVHDADRMDLVVRQLVDAAAIAAGRLELKLERVSIGGIVEEAIDFAVLDPEHPDVVWMGEDVEATVDVARARALLLAFIEAEVWWAQSGPIELRAGAGDSGTWIEAFRRNSGVAQAEAADLFMPRRPGTGGGGKIGLFVAKGVAEAQGGSVTADLTDGVRLRVFLPS